MQYSSSLRSTAISATLHCLTGCAIGEILGLIIGTAFGWHVAATTVLAIGLAFIFGYSLSLFSLRHSGLALGAAISIVLAADTLSILTMEVVDNAVMLVIPGAMNAGLANPIFWISMIISLTIAFFAAVPVNYFLIKRGRGHAHMHGHHSGHGH